MTCRRGWSGLLNNSVRRSARSRRARSVRLRGKRQRKLLRKKRRKRKRTTRSSRAFQELLIVASAPLRLRLDDEDMMVRWEDLPENTRVSVLALLARLIAKGVMTDDEDGGDD